MLGLLSSNDIFLIITHGKLDLDRVSKFSSYKGDRILEFSLCKGDRVLKFSSYKGDRILSYLV
jgi:hypothetical protein